MASLSATFDAGDELSRLYQAHHGWLQSLLRRKLGHAGDAADLAQDAFLRLLQRPRRFDSDEGARAYLSTMAQGLCVDLWRRRQIEQVWLETLAAQPEASWPSPEATYLVLETLWEVDAMLRALPAKTAEAFVMAQVLGMGYREIADQLAVSERTIKKYMASAVLHCALYLQQHPATP